MSAKLLGMVGNCVLGEYLAQQVPFHEEDPSLEMHLRNQWLWLEQGVIEYAPAVQAVSN